MLITARVCLPTRLTRHHHTHDVIQKAEKVGVALCTISVTRREERPHVHGHRNASTYGLAFTGRGCDPATHFRPIPSQHQGYVLPFAVVITATGLPHVRHIQNPVSVGLFVVFVSFRHPSKRRYRDCEAAQ